MTFDTLIAADVQEAQEFMRNWTPISIQEIEDEVERDAKFDRYTTSKNIVEYARKNCPWMMDLK